VRTATWLGLVAHDAQADAENNEWL